MDRDDTFERARPRLMGLAYRILGSRADAEDAVQDIYLKWRGTDPSTIASPDSWLTTLCTRRCIDVLRSAHRSRVEYVGAWLPEPIQTPSGEDAEHHAELASSLTTAFLLVLERLTPKERAAYLLREVFDVSYEETARALEMQETACRKLVSRAKTHVDRSKVRHHTPRERQEELLAAFETAVVEGRTDRLAALLSDDIEVHADSGGKVISIREPVVGKTDVLGFVGGNLHAWWGAYEWSLVDLNGARAIVLRKDGAAIATVSFAYDESGAASRVFIVRNPDKLAGLSSAPS